MTDKKCETPNCGYPLAKSEHESTLTHTKFYCTNPQCRRLYVIPTMTGHAVQLSPLASFGLLAVGLLTLDLDSVIDHSSDFIVGLIDGGSDFLS